METFPSITVLETSVTEIFIKKIFVFQRFHKEGAIILTKKKLYIQLR